jgi:CheY-like chemotaxis protein
MASNRTKPSCGLAHGLRWGPDRRPALAYRDSDGSRSLARVSPVSRSPQVLVVEDDRDIRDSMGRVLTEEGYDFAAAANGREALLYLHANEEPALILLDLIMPVMDGHGFMAEIDREPRLSAVAIVLLTAGRPPPPTPRVAQILQKPFRWSQLLAVVRRHCAPSRNAAPATPLRTTTR